LSVFVSLFLLSQTYVFAANSYSAGRGESLKTYKAALSASRTQGSLPVRGVQALPNRGVQSAPARGTQATAYQATAYSADRNTSQKTFKETVTAERTQAKEKLQKRFIEMKADKARRIQEFKTGVATDRSQAQAKWQGTYTKIKADKAKRAETFKKSIGNPPVNKRVTFPIIVQPSPTPSSSTSDASNSWTQPVTIGGTEP